MKLRRNGKSGIEKVKILGKLEQTGKEVEGGKNYPWRGVGWGCGSYGIINYSYVPWGL